MHQVLLTLIEGGVECPDPVVKTAVILFNQRVLMMIPTCISILLLIFKAF